MTIFSTILTGIGGLFLLFGTSITAMHVIAFLLGEKPKGVVQILVGIILAVLLGIVSFIGYLVDGFNRSWTTILQSKSRGVYFDPQ